MSQHEARAWWADVQDLRERIESRRAGDAPAVLPASARVAELHRIAPASAHPDRSAPRRTVTITGRPAPSPAPRALVAASRERPSRTLTAATRSPDRIAGWAALLGLVLVLVSTATN